MEYRMPSYYNEFKCIAGDCPCTCCSGWGIYIDDKTYDKYKKSEHKDFIMSHIDKEEQCFSICDGRCSFLNKDNLCDLIIRAGEDHLCDTCRRYPRHFEVYGNLVEAALSMSCPVVARMIVSRPEKDVFKYRTNEKKSRCSKEVSRRLLNKLLVLRKQLFSIAMNRNKDIDMRMKEILLVSEHAQNNIYGRKKNNNGINELLQENFAKKSRYMLMKQYFDMLLGLEMINEDWPALVNDIMKTLYEDLNEEEYLDLVKEYDSYMETFAYEYEHILIYFLYTYFLGGVYDKNIMGMVKMSVLSTMYIREISMAHFLKNGKKLTMDERIEHCYLYSRQIEHSDDNLLSLEGILTAHPLCDTLKLIEMF